MAGLQISASGQIQSVAAASTLDEAAMRSNRLRALLEQRGAHSEVLRACSKLLLRDENYFHAAFEVMKSIADRLRAMSGSSADGAELIDATLEKGSRTYPLIALNRYDSPSCINDQRGIAHLARGLIHAFRNVTAHEPHDKWPISQQDALDMISIASLIHRRLDGAAITTAI